MVKTGQQWSGTFCTKSATGALTAATGNPVGALYVDGVVNGAGVTVTGANPYKWTVTLPALTEGQTVSMYITATISTIASGAVVAEDIASVRALGDLAYPTTSGRSIDVESTGEVGLDFNNVKAATAPTTLTNITVPVVSAVTGLTAANLDTTVSSRAVAGDAMTLANDAITSAKFDESTAYPLKAADTGSTYLARTGADSDTLETLSDQVDGVSATAIADAVWDEATAGHVAAGSFGLWASGLVAAITAALTAATAYLAAIAAAIWAYATRTLTSTAASTVSAVSGSTLNITAHATYSATLTGLTISASWEKIWFTVKTSRRSDADASSLVMILETNPADAVNDGLIVLNSSSTTTKSQASLTVDQAAGTIAITIADNATTSLAEAYDLEYDVKQLVSGATTILTEGTCNVALAVTRTIA